MLRGHTAAVMAASFAWTDEHSGLPTLLSGSGDGEVRLWSLYTHRTVTKMAAHPDSSVLTVSALVGPRILSQGRDGFVRVWDVTTDKPEPLLELPSNCYNFCQCAVSEGLAQGDAASLRLDGEVCSGSNDSGSGGDSGSHAPLLAMPSADAQQLLLWDLRQRAAARTLNPSRAAGSAGMCMCARFALSDSLLLSGWEDGSIQSFDLRAATSSATSRKVHTEPVLCLEVGGKGEASLSALSGAADRFLCVTPLMDGAPAEPLGKLPIPVTNEASGSGGLASIAMRPDGKIFAAGGWDHRVRLWQWRKLKPLAILKLHTATVNAVCFSACSRWLASASSDNFIGLWALFPPKGKG